MKKIILFLLFTSFLQAQTYSSISALIDLNLASGSKITAMKHREVEHALLDYIQANISQSGDIKAIKCDLTYLNANFEANGLGKNLRAGWAICNGNNGTDNLSGRVIVQNGAGYALGQTGGSKDAVVVAHSHSLSKFNPTNGSGTVYNFDSVGDKEHFGLMDTESSGVSGVDKNMQPYIVELYIQKL